MCAIGDILRKCFVSLLNNAEARPLGSIRDRHMEGTWRGTSLALAATASSS